MLGTLLLSIYLLCTVVSGQNFLVPQTWLNPTSTLSRNTREGLAHAVVDSVSGLFNSTSGTIDVLEAGNNPTTNPADQSAYLLAAISRTDYFAGNTTFQSTVINNLNAAFQLNPRISTAWGLAAINAHRAYNDTTSLNYAIAMWNQTSMYQIQASDVARGHDQVQNVTLPANCNGASVVGGVFSGAGDSTPNVPAEAVAAFMTLSAQLYEATGDNQYLVAAESAAEFTQAHLYSSAIIQDTFLVDSCQIANIPVYSYASGFTIWGLSILATHNQTWEQFLLNLISTSVPYSGWTNSSDGIIIEAISSPSSALTNSVLLTLRTIFIRGLHEAWTRMDPTSEPANYIQSYLLVQFNALLNKATVPGSNLYSANWEGPPEPAFQAWGQLDALDVMNAAFSMAPASNSTTTTSSSPAATSGGASNSTHTTTPKPSNAGIIAGAIVGGVVFICIVAAAVFFLLRRRRRQTQAGTREIDLDEPMTESREGFLADPYQYTAPSMPEWSKGGGYGTSQIFPAPSETRSNTVPLTATQESTYSSEPGQPSLSQNTQDTGSQLDDATDLPRAIAQLNRVLARLPPGALEGDAPPRYE